MLIFPSLTFSPCTAICGPTATELSRKLQVVFMVNMNQYSSHTSSSALGSAVMNILGEGFFFFFFHRRQFDLRK